MSYFLKSINNIPAGPDGNLTLDLGGASRFGVTGEDNSSTADRNFTMNGFDFKLTNANSGIIMFESLATSKSSRYLLDGDNHYIRQINNGNNKQLSLTNDISLITDNVASGFIGTFSTNHNYFEFKKEYLDEVLGFQSDIIRSPTTFSGTHYLPIYFNTGGPSYLEADANGVVNLTSISSGGGGVTSMAVIGSTPNANAGTISGSTLTLQPASASFGGVVTTGAQTFAGDKTFIGVIGQGASSGNKQIYHTSGYGLGISAASQMQWYVPNSASYAWYGGSTYINGGGTTSLWASIASSGMTLYGNHVISTTPQSTTSVTFLKVIRPTVGGSYYPSVIDFNTYSYRPEATIPYTPGTQLDIRMSAGITGISDTTILSLRDNGNVGFGVTAPMANIHLKAGTASPNTAPLKFSAGVKLTTPEAGVIEYVTGNFILQNDGLTIGSSSGSVSALVDLQSTSKGILIPRMTATLRDAITSPATGLEIFNTTNNSFDYYNGSAWVSKITGTGVSGRVSYWNGTNTITSASNFTFDGTTLVAPKGTFITSTAAGLTDILRLGANSSSTVTFSYTGTSALNQWATTYGPLRFDNTSTSGGGGATTFANAGNIKLLGTGSAGVRFLTIQRAIPIVVNDAIEIMSGTIANGTSLFEIDVTTATASFSLTKKYFAAASYNVTGGAWQKLMPLTRNNQYTDQDFDIDILVSEQAISLRIRRIIGTTAGNADITLKVQGTADIVPTSATYSTTDPGVYFSSSILTQYNGGVGINTYTPNNSAALEISSTSKGFLMPRMNTTQRDSITSPATGLIIYNNTSSTYDFYNGTMWVSLSTGGGGASSKFGFAGEDVTASANRSFSLGVYKFDITGSGTNTINDRVLTVNYSGTHYGGSAIRATTSTHGSAIDAIASGANAIGVNASGYYGLYAQGTGNGDAVAALAGSGTGRGLQVSHAYTGSGDAVYITKSSGSGTTGVPLYIQQYGNGTGTSLDFIKITTGVFNQLSSHSLNVRGTWSNSGAGSESNMFRIKINKTNVTNTLVANAELQVATSNLVMSTGLQIMGTGDVVFPNIRTYADDAEADADTTLISKSMYLISGSRIPHIKP